MTPRLMEFPPPGGWTTNDLDELPEDGRRRELLDGVLLMSPSPTHLHQSVAARLGVALEDNCPPEYDATHGVEIRISKARSFIPDVLVTRFDAAARNPSHYWPHEVLLAVEIVSECTRIIDGVLKPALYAEAEIPYYWRIEIESGLVLYPYRLDPTLGQYVAQAEQADGIRLAEPWEIDIPLSRLTPRRR